MKTGMKILIVLLATMFFVGCGGDDEQPGERTDYDGWMLTKWKDSADLAGKVYLQLNSDQSFSLYQNILTPGFRKYTGTYTVTEEDYRQVLSGTYFNGDAWKYSYVIESRDDKMMVMTSLGEQIVSEYVRVVVPEYVKQDDDPEVRTDDGDEPFL